MYADRMTDSMKGCIDETNRRRAIQEQYNIEHGITPKTIIKDIRPPLSNTDKDEENITKTIKKHTSKKDMDTQIKKLEKEMREAAKVYDFERAAQIRDIIFELKGNA